jgi:hypothetical protein
MLNIQMDFEPTTFFTLKTALLIVGSVGSEDSF